MKVGEVVWLLTTGDGSDGNDWNVQSIYRTMSGAKKAKREYEKPIKRKDGSTYITKASIEAWPIFT